MRKITFLFLLSMCFSFVQVEDNYQATISKITEAYNAKEANQLFELFSADLQSTFTNSKVTTFISDQFLEKGKIIDSSFLIEGDGYKQYLVEFENSSAILNLGLSSDNKITLLKIEEY